MIGLVRPAASVPISGVGCGPTLMSVRTHLGYIPRQGPANTRANEHEQTKIQIRKVNMKPVKKVHYKLDPFHPKPHSILNVMTHLSNEKIQKSNPKCLWKTEMVSDRSEPTIKIELNEGDSLLFKTANLKPLEILEIMNDYVLPRVVVESKQVADSGKPKAAAGGAKGKKGKK